MFGLGTLINAAAIVLGGILGALFGKLIKPEHQDALSKVCGVSVLFIGISGGQSAAGYYPCRCRGILAPLIFPSF